MSRLTEVRPGRVTALVRADGVIYATGYAHTQHTSDSPALSQAYAQIRDLRRVIAIEGEGHQNLQTPNRRATTYAPSQRPRNW